MAFLKAEWKILTYFVIIVAILLGVMASSNPHSHWSIALAFVLGAVCSAVAGYIGMKAATKANVRTAQAARTSLSKALNVSFTGGAVMGLGVAGLAVLGLGAVYLILKQTFAPGAAANSEDMLRTIEVLTGFSLGAESIALFARVGGGIYTKAADVGADLVGKVEAGIPEDDPRNPATIADNVGDNVGDVAGMGADLFGSYVATVLATMVLGQETISTDNFGGYAPILLPMLIAGGIWGSYECAGLYGVAIAAAGMMATTAMQLAIDAFGPIADNAGGIAEMSELPKDVREKTDVLDAVGNTTAATGKGFAIASAALTALALFAAFVGVAGIKGIDIYKAKVLASLFVGAMIPFIFSSLAIRAVGQAAMAMVEEVRRQFRTIKGIMEGTGKPEYDKCVAISTEASIKKMMLPGAIAIALL
eukprot:jgi/Mesen1/3037/ME001791S02302